MKLKYYLRGLGTGIFVTTLILSIAFEVRMSKRDTLNSNISEEETMSETETEMVTSAIKDTTESTGEQTTTEENTKGSIKEEETTQETQESTTEQEITESESQEETTIRRPSATVTIDIYSGMSSNKVAARLEELGVIEDAQEFNEYIYDNRAENRIRTGRFDISQDATYEEIVSIITGS